MELNALKTSILALPCRLEDSWVSDLRSRPLRSKAAGEATDLVTLFDTAFAHASSRPELPVLRYVMGRLKTRLVNPQNWQMYQHLLMNCMTAEPATIPGAMTALIPHIQQSYGIEDADLTHTFNSIILHHAALGHGHEVAWALWSLMTLGLKVSQDAVVALGKSTDATVALLAMHSDTLGLLDAQLDKQAWHLLATKESLQDENWLLAYEGTKKGWLQVNPNFITRDTGFSYLWQTDVEFYDVRRIASPQPSGIPPSIGIAPTFY